MEACVITLPLPVLALVALLRARGHSPGSRSASSLVAPITRKRATATAAPYPARHAAQA
jgi:hypothetical protein